jgi:hypothetical protein
MNHGLQNRSSQTTDPKKPGIHIGVLFVSLLLCVASQAHCGEAISDAQNFTPNSPPTIHAVTVNNPGNAPVISYHPYLVTVTASDPDRNDLSYTFRSNDGSFEDKTTTATGCSVNFIAGDLAGGEEIIVSVSVTDKRGGTAVSSVNVGTAKQGPTIVVSASRTAIKSNGNLLLSVSANCEGVFQLWPDSATAPSAIDTSDPTKPMRIYKSGTTKTLKVAGPNSIAGTDLKLTSKAAYPNETYYHSWVVFRDGLRQIDVVETPIRVDDEAPEVTSLSPVDGESNVSLTPTIAITFDEDIDPATLPGALTVTSISGDGTVGAPTYDAATHTARYPVSGLTQAEYIAELGDDVADLLGNTIGTSASSIHFRTIGFIPGTWARTATGGSNSSLFHSIAVDNNGNIYAAGIITGNNQFSFGNGVTVTGIYSGGTNGVLVKYNGSGVAQWAQTETVGSNSSLFYSVAVDSSGNVYTTGYITGTSTFSFGNGVTATGKYNGENILLVKYNGSGVAQWARTVTAGSDNSRFQPVTVDSSGNIYAAGYMCSTSTFSFGNGVNATGTSGLNIILIKYNGLGVAQWARTVTAGSSASHFSSIKVDGERNIYAAGTINGNSTLSFGSGVTATGTSIDDNIELVKYNESGTAQWARTVTTGSNASTFESVTIDNIGNIYAAGGISGTTQFSFGNGVTATGTNSICNILLVKYNKSGEAQWARTVTAGSNKSVFYFISKDNNGNIYTAGYITGTNPYSFGNGVTVTGTYTGDNVVLVKYNGSGEAQWARTVTTGTNVSHFRSVTADNWGNVYAAGYISGTNQFSFGNGVTATGTYTGSNAVLVKY